MTGYNFKQYIRVLTFTVFIMTCISSISFAATYYVATTGNDGNAGTSSAPFKTIQKGLNTVQPGDTCTIRGGTYNEALVLVQSGTSSAPITIQNYTGETVTINSGTSKAVRTNGRKHYYTFNGLRIISTHTVYDSYGADYSLDFQDGIWDGNTDPTGGNNGFIIRNCYIEGAIRIYGHNVLVENCELNGKSLWGNGIWECYAPSHDNIYRKNTIYGYSSRGIWSMQYTSNVLIANNIIHDSGNMGIDCDGAGHPVYYSTVRNNTIYNVGGRGIEMENAFNSVTEGNIIYNSSKWGINYINYGFGPDYTSDAEYRNQATNAIIRNNLIYNTAEAGIILNGSPGNRIYNNTIYKNTASSYFAGLALCSYGNYPCINTLIKNNILAECSPYAIWIESPTLQLQGLQMSNNLYYSSANTTTHYVKGFGSYTLANFKTAAGQEQNSIFANPSFVNPAGGDFHLSSASPAVDAGITLSDVPADLSGTPRPQGLGYDMGAYELSSGQSASIPAPQNMRVIN